MPNSTHAVLRERFLVLALILATLYGVSYQQFRHFDYSDDRGVGDSHSYVAMAQGNWDVSVVHRYRFIIPFAAGTICKALNHCDPAGLIPIFYALNFCITAATSMFLYLFLRRMGFRQLLSLLGVLLFITSRVTVMTAATPIIDSLYYLAIVLIAYLVLVRRFVLLLALYPCLILAKETVIPFLFLPLLSPSFRGWRYWGSWAAALGVSLVVFVAVRRFIGLSPTSGTALVGGFWDVVVFHLHGVLGTVRQMFSLRGLHDVQNGFSFVLPMAVIGFVINRRERLYEVPSFLLLSVPIAVAFALLSGNIGRMIFSAFTLIIPYALVVVDSVLRENEAGSSVSAVK